VSDPDERPSYPPERHALRDLDVTTEFVTAERAISIAAIDDPVRNAAGAASLGFLTAVLDTNTGLLALISVQPEWTATLDLSLHATGWLTGGPLVLESRVVRAGSNIVVMGAELYDGLGIGDIAELHGHPGRLPRIAYATVSFTRIPARASVASGRTDPAAMIGQRRHLGPVYPPDPVPLAERIGLQVVDAPSGVVELHNHDYVRNSFGTINGGVWGVVFEGAAHAAVPGMLASDVQIHYLSQAKVGPARTSVDVLRRGDDHAVCAVRAVDAGNDDVNLALATVTLQRTTAGAAGVGAAARAT
jgi:acyl-coenzyme A thioesterase PaaI-like protein